MSTREMAITLEVNGEAVQRTVPVRLNLVDFLRGELGLTGSHVGCEHGVCGACTVLVDDEPVRGCLMLAVQADGTSIQTIEGLSESGTISALQDAFINHNALQCGYCTPAMLISAHAYLAAGGTGDHGQIREAISGNYCRCTGYQSVVEAIADVAAASEEGRS